MALNVKSLEGKEISYDYTRKASTENKWAEAWDVLKNNFGKIVFINLIMLVFFIPVIALFVLRSLYVGEMGNLYPFNANVGIGYPAYTGLQGLTENIYFSSDVLFYSLLVIAGLVASIGISGGAYSIKKIVSTKGEFSFKKFFTKGVKTCYFNAVLPTTIFTMFYILTVFVGDWKDIALATNNGVGGAITAYVFSIIATVLVGFYCAWLLAVGVSFKLTFTQLIKNSFVLFIGTSIQSIFMAAIALLPIWFILLGSLTPFIQVIAYMAMIFLGLSFMLLVWMSFSQAIFDMFVTPNLKPVPNQANTKKSNAATENENEIDEKELARALLAAGKSELIGRPILPISDNVAVQALGNTFTRADMARIEEDKTKLNAQITSYSEQHKNDPLYAEYNKLFADREKVVGSEDKKNKKKKISSDNLLK